MMPKTRYKNYFILWIDLREWAHCRTCLNFMWKDIQFLQYFQPGREILSEYFQSYWLKVLRKISLPFYIFQGEQCNASTPLSSLSKQVDGRSIKKAKSGLPRSSLLKVKVLAILVESLASRKKQNAFSYAKKSLGLDDRGRTSKIVKKKTDIVSASTIKHKLLCICQYRCNLFKISSSVCFDYSYQLCKLIYINNTQ